MAVIEKNNTRYVIVDAKDIGKSREDLLIDLLYEAWGTRFPKDKIVFGKPNELDQRPKDLYDPNTFIPVKVDVEFDRRFTTPEAGIMYRRLSLSDYVKDVDFTAVKPEFFPFRISDLLDQINSFLPYALNMDDLVEYEYSTAEQWANGIRLDPLPESYIWTKGQTVFIDSTQINHQNLLTQHTLDGFNIYRAEGAPIPIPGFEVHSGGCTTINCPICSPAEGQPAGEVDPRARGYVDMIQRTVNKAFRSGGTADQAPTDAAAYLNEPADPAPQPGSEISVPDCGCTGEGTGTVEPEVLPDASAYKVTYPTHLPSADSPCGQSTQPAPETPVAGTGDCGCTG